MKFLFPLLMLAILCGCQNNTPVTPSAPPAPAAPAAEVPMTPSIDAAATEKMVVIPPPPPVKSFDIVATYFSWSKQEHDDFIAYTLPHVDAVMVRTQWALLEPTKGKFDFSSLDADMKLWTDQGKKVVVIGELISDAIVNGPPGGVNVATPAWVLKDAKMLSCAYEPKAFPTPNQQPFMGEAQSFIAALLKHLEGNSKVLYVRLGFVEGGETCPICIYDWPGFTYPNFITYLTDMSKFVKGLNSSVRMVQGQGNGPTTAIDESKYQAFAENGLGIGMQALRATDAAAYAKGQPCSDDWCAGFKKYPGAYKYLQAFPKQADGSLTTYMDFAKQFKVNSYELWVPDLDVAFNPKNAKHAQYGAAYAKALTTQ